MMKRIMFFVHTLYNLVQKSRKKKGIQEMKKRKKVNQTKNKTKNKTINELKSNK